MKFLPFFLISFVLALVFNGLEAASDDLEKLFLDAKKEVDWQNNRIAWMQPSLNILSSGGQEEPRQLADRLEEALKDVKDEDLKSRLETIEKSRKSLVDIKIKLDAYIRGVELYEKKLRDREEKLGSLPQQAADSRELFASVKSEYKSQAEKVEKVEKLIRSERNKNEKHAANILKAEKLLTEMRDEANLQQFQNIPKAVKSFDDLKKKSKSQAEDLATLRSVKDEAEKPKEVEAAKKLLRELEAEVKAQGPKFLAADLLIEGATAVLESQLKLAAAAPSLDAVKFEKQSNPHVLEIEELLHELNNNIKLQDKPFADAAKLYEAVVKLTHAQWIKTK